MPDTVAVNAAYLAYVKWMEERLAKAKQHYRAELVEQMEVTQRQPVVVDGVHVAAVTLAKGAESAIVTDRDALTRWVQANHPEHIRMRPTVDEYYLKDVLAATERARMPMAPDGEADPDGIAYTTGVPSLRVTSVRSEEASTAIASTLRNGQAAHLLALPAVEES